MATEGRIWALVPILCVYSFASMWIVPPAPNTKFPLVFDFNYALQAGTLCLHDILLGAYEYQSDHDRGMVWAWGPRPCAYVCALFCEGKAHAVSDTMWQGGGFSRTSWCKCAHILLPYPPACISGYLWLFTIISGLRVIDHSPQMLWFRHASDKPNTLLLLDLCLWCRHASPD